MTTPQEKEFSAFGFVSKNLRAGLIIGLLTISITGNIVQNMYTNSVKDRLYEKIINRADSVARDQANKSLDQPIKNINRATARIDTAIKASMGAASTAQDAGNEILKVTKNK